MSQKPHYPKGFKLKDGRVRIAVAFDEPVFKRLKRGAEKDGTGFSQYVQNVVACGLLCLAESDAFELADTKKQADAALSLSQ